MIQTAQAKALRRVVSTRLPTSSGLFQIVGFERETPSRRPVETALGILLGDLTENARLLRIHSQGFTGEVLGPLPLDCRDQLEGPMATIPEHVRAPRLSD